MISAQVAVAIGILPEMIDVHDSSHVGEPSTIV